LSRIIKTETIGKDRNRLLKVVAIGLRELVRQPDITTETRDIAAFIALSLIEIEGTIDPTVLAWEKRGYWVKADRFRMEWSWAEKLGTKLKQAIIDDDWATVAIIASEIAGKIKNIKIPQQNNIGKPWAEASSRLATTNSH
jgi:hypothetical protein